MFKKICSILLATLLINSVGMRITYAGSKEEKQARFAEKVKANVLKLGVGEATHVKIKLRNKTKLEGYLSDVGQENFTVTDRAGTATVVVYPQVKSVKGNNLSTGAKIAIGVGIAAAVIIFLIYYVKVVENDE